MSDEFDRFRMKVSFWGKEPIHEMRYRLTCHLAPEDGFCGPDVPKTKKDYIFLINQLKTMSGFSGFPFIMAKAVVAGMTREDLLQIWDEADAARLLDL